VEPRIEIDRRRRPTSLWGALRLSGRRHSFRSDEESINAYSDCARPVTVTLVLFVVIASGFDALFTLLHLETGAREANPLMRFALDHGILMFLAAKVALTALGCSFLAVHQNFALGFKGLRCLTIAYVVLLVYHAAIFAVNS
jgi:hypothetical protein